ncbi:MAG: DnaD domain protein, partial [Oscillospiraceae bacterium]
MANCLLQMPGDDSVTLSGAVTRRLIEQGDGDAALLYLCLLRHRGEVSPESAGRQLKWEKSRTQHAEDSLRALGLVGAATPAEAVEPEAPVYGREDVAQSLEQNGEFRLLTAEVERKLGKKLSTPDVSILLGLYDYLGLPIDVIFLLVSHCVERVSRHYGPGRRPGLRQIEKEGYSWARLGIDTQERAVDYLKKYAARQGQLPQYMAVLQMGGRLPAPSEEKYLAAWLDMGFSPEAVALAYDRTMLRCHELKWGYLNGILKRWHEKGLHTTDEILQGDGGGKKPESTYTTPSPPKDSGDREKIAKMQA